MIVSKFKIATILLQNMRKVMNKISEPWSLSWHCLPGLQEDLVAVERITNSTWYYFLVSEWCSNCATYILHLIRAGSIDWPLQSFSIPQSSQQTHCTDTREWSSATCEHLPTCHSKRPLRQLMEMPEHMEEHIGILCTY